MRKTFAHFNRFLCRIPGQAQDRMRRFSGPIGTLFRLSLCQSVPSLNRAFHPAATDRKPHYALGELAVKGLPDASDLHSMVPLVMGLPFTILPSFMETQPGFSGNLAT
jgi:hypothetical protein